MMDEVITETNLENAEHIAATIKVLGESGLEVIRRASDSRDRMVDKYKETKLVMEGINQKTDKETQKARGSFGLDLD